MADALIEALCSGLGLNAVVAASASSINGPNLLESYPLHAAVHHNSLHGLQLLLEAGANPDVVDGESGWTPLHKALYLGHLSAAAALLRAGASLDIADHRGRLPPDLVSSELRQRLGPWAGELLRRRPLQQQQQQQQQQAPVAHERPQQQPQQQVEWGAPAVARSSVFAWGSGANWQLGVGSQELHEAPVRVDHGLSAELATAVSASKFHSAAVTGDGRAWAWGWARGGRLGIDDALLALMGGSRGAAQIVPRPLDGLGRRQVVAVAAAKHHTLAATSAGELWSWGSNRWGALGYPAGDTQPTPKRVALLRQRVVAVAAANKHSAAITTAGEVYTWGGNCHGQCGYGTNKSDSNPTPRLVESLKGRPLVAVSAAKHHTLVLTSDGEVWTFGHRVVTPRKVPIWGSRDAGRAGPAQPAAAATGGAGPLGSSPRSHGSVPGGLALATAALAASPAAAGGAAAAAAPAAAAAWGDVRFHRGQGDVARPVAAAIAAGAAHSSCVTREGAVLTWRSAAPQPLVQEVGGPLAGRRAAGIAAGKTRTAVVTEDGDVFTFEGLPPGKGDYALSGQHLLFQGAPPPLPQQQAAAALGTSPGGYSALAAAALGGAGAGGGRAAPVLPVRVPGVKHASLMAVGEKHTLVVQYWSAPELPEDATSHGQMLATPAPRHQRRRWPQPQAGRGAAPPGRQAGGWRDEAEDGFGGDDGDDVIAAGADFSDDDGALAGTPNPPDARSGLGGSLQTSDGTPRPDAGTTSGWDSSLVGFGGGVDASDGGGTLAGAGGVEPLHVMCQRSVARSLVEPRTVLPVLEWADAAGAHLLRSFCAAMALRNLDVLLLEARHSLEVLPGHLLLELERLYQQWYLAAPAGPATSLLAPQPAGAARAAAGAPWEVAAPPPGSEGGRELAAMHEEPDQPFRRQRRRPSGLAHLFSGLQQGPRPTAPAGSTCAPADQPRPHKRAAAAAAAALDAVGHHAAALSIHGRTATFTSDGGKLAAEQEAAAKLLRHLAKKLQQIASLEEREQHNGELNAQQQIKRGLKSAYQEAVQQLRRGRRAEDVQVALAQAQAAAAKLAGLEPAAPSDGSSGAAGADAVGSSRSGPAGEREGAPPGAADAPPPRRPARETQQPERQAAAAAAGEVGCGGAAGTGPGLETVSEASGSDGSSGFVVRPSTGAAAAAPAPSAPSSSSKKQQPRKGGLSMFLSGALENKPPPPPQPPQPPPPQPRAALEAQHARAPAWGGASPAAQQRPVQTPSLRELLDGEAQQQQQQHSTSHTQHTQPRTHAADKPTPAAAAAATSSASGALVPAGPSPVRTPPANRSSGGGAITSSSGGGGIKKQQQVKGGLSMFLSGALQQQVAAAHPAPLLPSRDPPGPEPQGAPSSKGPAWGGAAAALKQQQSAAATGGASLRELLQQEEERKQQQEERRQQQEERRQQLQAAQRAAGSSATGAHLLGTSPGLGSVRGWVAPQAGGAALGSSPSVSSPLQQMLSAGSLSRALGTPTAAQLPLGSSPGSFRGGSFLSGRSPPSASAAQSKWYIADDLQPQVRSLADIQSEEVAAQLAREEEEAAAAAAASSAAAAAEERRRQRQRRRQEDGRGPRAHSGPKGGAKGSGGAVQEGCGDGGAGGDAGTQAAAAGPRRPRRSDRMPYQEEAGQPGTGDGRQQRHRHGRQQQEQQEQQQWEHEAGQGRENDGVQPDRQVRQPKREQTERHPRPPSERPPYGGDPSEHPPQRQGRRRQQGQQQQGQQQQRPEQGQQQRRQQPEQGQNAAGMPPWQPKGGEPRAARQSGGRLPYGHGDGSRPEAQPRPPSAARRGSQGGSGSNLQEERPAAARGGGLPGATQEAMRGLGGAVDGAAC